MAVGTALATAFVRIRPDTSGFGRDLDAQVRREAGGQRVGESVGRDIGQGLNRGIDREVDGRRTGQKIGKDIGDGVSRGLSPMLTAAVGLGPALIPVLAASTAAAGGLGVALVSGGAALGVFGAVAKTSFKAIQDNLKLAKKGTEDLTSPIGRATTAYEGLTAAWDKFVAHNQPQTFRIFGAGFSILTTAIPKLQPLFDVASEAVARFEGQLSHFVSGGGLDRLVGFLGANARPALEAFRQTLTNVGTGLGALGPLFSRFSGGVEVGLVSLSAKFAAWAQNAGPGGGFQKFINYVVSTGPEIVSTLHELASAVVNIAQGLAPLGPVSLTFVGAMARLVAVLPPGVITGMVSGFLALQTALKVTSAVGLNFTSNVGEQLRLVFQEVPAGLRASSAALVLFKGAMAAAPLGLATLALTALVGVFVRHSQAVAESRAKTEEFRTTLDRTTGAITLDTRALAAHNLQTSGALDAARQFGINLSTLTDAAVGNQSAIDQVNKVLNAYVATQQEAVTAGDNTGTVNRQASDAYNKLKTTLGQTTAQVADAQVKQRQLAAATQPTTVAIISQTQAAANAKRQMEQLATQLLKVAGINLTVAQSDIAFRDSLTALSQSVQQNGKSLDLNTAKGRANRSAVLDSISAALQHADAVGKQTGSQTRAQRAFEDSIPSIERQAAKLGLNKRQVDALVRSVGGLRPKTVEVGVVVKGSSITLSGGRASVVTGPGTRAIRQTGFAAGGVMPGWTPGRDVHTFTSPTGGRLDLSGGEAVMRPEWTRAVGAGAVERMNAVARTGGTSGVRRFLGGFAGGGIILNGPGSTLSGISGSVNSAVNSAAVAAARAAVQALISSGRLTAAPSSLPFSGSGSVSRWLPVVLQVLAALGRPASESGANLRRIAFESGGNPNAINLTDSNARAGHPSQGLMQTIPATFAAFAGPYVSRGITDAFANIYAGDNYAIHRYGSVAAIDPLVRPRGYDSGGWLQPGLTLAMNGTGRPERIRTGAQEDALLNELRNLRRDLGNLPVAVVDDRYVRRQQQKLATRDPAGGW